MLLFADNNVVAYVLRGTSGIGREATSCRHAAYAVDDTTGEGRADTVTHMATIEPRHATHCHTATPYIRQRRH